MQSCPDTSAVGSGGNDFLFSLQRSFDALPIRLGDSNSDVARLPENLPKNRYPNVVPYDSNRVKLPQGRYINASHVHVMQKHWVVTQGPMKTTVQDFWEMIYSEGIDCVVMLTELMENARSKCTKYWPDVGAPLALQERKLIVKNMGEMKVEKTVHDCRQFRIVKTDSSSAAVHNVTQFQFHGWPDFGVPGDLDDLLTFIGAYRKKGSDKTLVHCSAGIGRTGTFLLIYTGLVHKGKYDPVAVLKELRSQRPGMVERFEQFKLAVFAVRKALECGKSA